MNRHRHLVLVVALLALAAGLRLWDLGTLPPGFSDDEINTLSITAHARLGRIVVFDSAHGQGQETLFPIVQTIVASLAGDGLITLRLPAVWAGLVALALVYALSRRLHGQRAASLALALMAVGFWPILLARLSLREALVPLFTAASLLALVNAFHIRRSVSPDPPTTAPYTATGIIIALSFYAHWFGLLLAAVITGVVTYLFLTRQPISRRAFGASAFAVLLSIIVIIPYAVTSLRQPGLSGLAAMRAALMPESVPSSIIDGLTGLFARGDQNPAYNLPGRPLLGPVTALLFFAGMGMGFRHWRRPASLIPALVASVLLIPALLSTRRGSFLPLVGALPLVYILAAWAADALLDRLADARPIWRRARPWLLAALVLLNLAWTGADLFGAWPSRADVRAAYYASRGLLAHHLDRTATRLPTIICSPQLLDTDARPGDPVLLDLMMQRENAPLRFVDCANGLIIAEGGAPQQFAFTDLSIRDRMHDLLASWLHNRPAILVPGLDRGSVLELNVQRQLENAVGRLLTTAPTGWAPESPGGAGPVPLPARFGGNLTFLGYAPPRDPVFAPGDVVPVITYWRADGPLFSDVRIFTHLLSDPAAIVAQSQAINVSASTLHNRDIFIQVSYVVLPPSAPPGSYDISTGLYRAESGLRLPVYDGERPRGDRLFLFQITVDRDAHASG